ncbi:MAG TPA: hypothetical protein QGH10_14575 [Armatimonadota bacterium]|nr:hypothetical protein [Armatimonadota bacterium]
MKQKAWLWALIRGLVGVGALVSLLGCSARPFAVTDRKTCKGIDATGNSQEETDVFGVVDTVYFWFQYTGAVPGQAIKVKFTYIDEQGNTQTHETPTELTPGSHSASAQLSPPASGETLVPGRYDVEILNDADVAYGPPLTFTIE